EDGIAIDQPREIRGAAFVADRRGQAGLWKGVGEIEANRGTLSDDRAVMVDRRDLLVRLDCTVAFRSTARRADVDDLGLVRLVQFLQQPEHSRGARPRRAIEFQHRSLLAAFDAFYSSVLLTTHCQEVWQEMRILGSARDANEDGRRTAPFPRFV